MAKKIKVAVIMGGPSEEYEVSLKSGENVISFMDKNNYEVMPVVISKEGEWDVDPEELKKRADVGFIAMHGRYGEDGTIQSELENLGIPYTGSDHHSSAFGMNKFLSLRAVEHAGFNVPPTVHIGKIEWLHNAQNILRYIEHYFEKPWVLKPNRSGSSVDTIFIDDKKELEDSTEDLLARYPDLIVQPYIKGREVTCGVLDSGFRDTAYALMPTEIVPNLSHFFDYKSKYEEGGAAEITPARFEDNVLHDIRRIAKEVHKIHECRGFSRTDMIVGDDGKIYVLEINTIPGLTKASLLPKGAEGAGISFSEMLNRIIKAALRL